MAEKRRKTALPGPRKNLHMMDPDELTLIGHDTDDGPEHSLYDPRVHNEPPEWMVISAMDDGILENVEVRKVIVDEEERYEIVFGRKRVRAAREANKRLAKKGSELRVLVPTMLTKDDDLALFSRMVIENELREDTDVLQKAELAARMRRMGADDEMIAKKFGVTPQTARNWDSVNSLCKDVKTAIRKGEISAHAAAKLSDFSSDEQVKQLKELKTEAKASGQNKVTNKRARSASKKAKGDHDTLEAPGKRLVKKVIGLEEAQNTLSDDFIRGVRWVLGDLNPTTIKGLSALIKEAEKNKRVKA